MNFFRQLLVCIIIVVSIIGYLPQIYMGGLYSLCRVILFVTTGLLIALTMLSKKQIQSCKFINTLFVLMGISALLFFAFFAFGLNMHMSDFVQVAIPVFGTYIGYNMNLSKSDVVRLLWLYIFTSIVVGVLSINTYMGVVEDSNPYLIEGKNQIGAIVAIASGLAFYLFCINHRLSKAIGLLCSFVLIVLGLMIGCRTAFVGSALCIIYTTYKTTTKKQFAIILTCVFVLGLILFEYIYAIFMDFFIGDRIVLNANDLSTGRMERNIAALEFISYHPLFGELKTLSYIPTIHNYLLINLVRYGILAFPFVAFYSMYLIAVLKGVGMTAKIQDIPQIGFIILIIPFFNSLLEPGAPFGPGSVFIFCYMLFGYSLSIIQLSK